MATLATQSHEPEVMLELDRVSKRFGGLVAVNELSFQVRRGQVLGLIGPNGAGKTTVFNLISGISPATSGQVKLGGQVVTGRPPHQIAQLGLARTFQEIHLFKGLSVLDNVKAAAYRGTHYSLLEALTWLGRTGRQERQLTAEAMTLLGRFGLADFAKAQADDLPYGLQKRLEVVKALITHPKVLLLDEPAAGLNTDETFELLELIKEVRREFGLTVLVIEHAMEVIEGISDHVVCINFGTKLAEGNWDEVHTNEEVIRCYLGVD
ncbi:MAG: ABC transporter ATP-binding protein [Chitinophagales bacterium]